jgi:hypothetical protein
VISATHGAEQVTYTNRQGTIYYLCSRSTPRGTARYYLAKRPTGDPVSRIPDGFEIRESVNGGVSIGRCQELHLAAEEVHAVQTVIDAQADPTRFRLAVKARAIELHEIADFLSEDDLATSFPWVAPRVSRENYRRFAYYSPRLRFVLVNDASRAFQAERMVYRSGFDGWRPVGGPGAITTLGVWLIPLISTDSFFEL